MREVHGEQVERDITLSEMNEVRALSAADLQNAFSGAGLRSRDERRLRRRDVRPLRLPAEVALVHILPVGLLAP